MRPRKLDIHALEAFNNSLRELYGVDTVTGQQMWRVSWSTDEYEMRETEFTDAGIQLLRPEVRLLPKYQWCRNRYVLEHLVGIPILSMNELPATKTSYEPIWVYEDGRGDYLPPSLEASKLIISTVQSAVERRKEGRTPLRKFVDEDINQETSIENQKKRVEKIVEELYGSDAAHHDAAIAGSAIHMPTNYDEVSKIESKIELLKVSNKL